MARTLSSQAVFHQLTGVFRLDDSATTTTTTADEPKGETSIAVTSGTSFANGDKIRFGPNGSTAEINEIASGGGTNTLTMKLPISQAIVSGTTVTKLNQTDLGATDENGVTIETTQGETAVVAGTQKKTYLYINQNIEEQFNFNLRDFDKENVAASLGYDETDAGVVDANGVVLNLDDAVSQSYQPWCFEGLREDGMAITAFLFSAKVASANQTLQFAEGAAAVIPFQLRSNGNRSFLFE